MADYCMCCGKKLGVFTGNHLNNTVCDNCFFKFAGYLEEMKNMETLEEVEARYINSVRIVSESEFLDEGRNQVIALIDEAKKKKCDEILEKNSEAARNVEEQKKHDQIEKQYKDLRVNILLTTGNNFEGYQIIEYCGVKSASVVLGTGFLSEFSASLNDIRGSEDNRMANKIEEAKASATNCLIEKCIYAGGNAIIGIEYDIMTIGSNMIVVSANGTSVKIDKKIKE